MVAPRLSLLAAGLFALSANAFSEENAIHHVPEALFSYRQSLATADADVLPPSEDPWYTAPDGFADAAPGTVLKMRTAPGNLTTVVANCSAAYNLLYRTTDSRYNASWAVTTVFIPSNSNDSSVNSNDRLLSYQIPYDSADVDASPSYALYFGPPADIALGLGQGWFINVPDYEGPNASFTAGVQSGHATLDSVRAVISKNSEFGLVPEAKNAMWGYSGGALASEWAAELQVQYAPTLQFAGVALGGLTPNITTVLFATNDSPFTGLIPAGILGISSQYPEARQYIVDHLKTDGPYNRTGFLSALNETLTGSITKFINQDIAQYFTNGLEALQAPISQYIINRDGIMGYHGVPQMPLFVYKAIGDEISPVNDTDILIDRYCNIGGNIWYQRNTVGGHSAEATNGDPRAFQFLTAVFDGFYNQTGCLIEDVTVTLSTSPL